MYNCVEISWKFDNMSSSEHFDYFIEIIKLIQKERREAVEEMKQRTRRCHFHPVPRDDQSRFIGHLFVAKDCRILGVRTAAFTEENVDYHKIYEYMIKEIAHYNLRRKRAVFITERYIYPSSVR